MGVKLNVCFCDPKRHILARNRVFWRILRQNPCGRLGCRRFEEPPTPKKRTNSWVNNLMREIAQVQKPNPLSNLDEILQDGRYPRRNHVGKCWWRSIKGYRGGGGQILAFPIDSDCRPYNTRTTVRVCDHHHLSFNCRFPRESGLASSTCRRTEPLGIPVSDTGVLQARCPSCESVTQPTVS